MKFLKFVPVLLALGSTVACTPMNRPAVNTPSEAVPQESARVVVSFPQSFPPSEVHVVEDEKLLGYLRNKQHFVMDVEPGEHTFMLIGSNEEAIQGEFLGGKTYHLRVFVTPGAFGSRTYWTPLKASDLESREKDLANSTLVELNPEKAASWEEDNSDDNREYSEEFQSGEEEAVSFGPEHAL